MTREQHLEIIRRACIEANPELAADMKLKTSQESLVILYENVISLADVLLAQDVALCDRMKESPVNEALTQRKWLFGEICHMWNLRKDDLAEQEDTTLQFLSDLLSKE